MKNVRSMLYALGFAVLLCSPASFAGSDSLLELLEVLESNGTIDARTADRLRESIVAERARYAEVAETGRGVAAGTQQASVSLKGGKLQIKSDDGDFKLGVHGRVQADYAYYDDDHRDPELGNGAEIRRARLSLKATLWEHWHFTSQYDFSGPSGHLRTLDLIYTGIEDWQFQIGHFHQPFGMEHQSSSKTISFMERALSDHFIAGRDMGIAAQYTGGMWRARAGLFLITDNDSEGATGKDGGDDPWEISGRFNFTPLHDPDRVLHLGIAAAYRSLEDQAAVRFRVRPESHVTNVRLVDTGILPARSRALHGLEAAWLHGPFSLMGEYVGVSLRRDMVPDLDFKGYYGQLSYVLTGESRQYKRNSGTWGGIRPRGIVGKGGYGAWEIAARFSHIDLRDGDVDGGEQDNFTLGVNWYLTPTIRLNANYVNVLNLDRGQSRTEPSVLQLRAQYEF